MKGKFTFALSIALVALTLPSLSAQQKQKSPKPGVDPFGAPGAAAPIPPKKAPGGDPFGGPGAAPKPPKPVSPAPPAPPQARFDIEFVQTPVSDACDYIASIVEDLTGQPINIVVSKEAEKIALPTMQLRQITFEQWVSFINRIGGADDLKAGGGGGRAMGSAGGMPGGGAPPIPHSGPYFGMTETDGIWYFWAEEPDREAVKLTTMVFPLDGDVEAALGLIEEALMESRRHGDNPEPTLKFHEPSGTLIASGSMEDLKLIDEVVEVMEEREEKLREAAAHQAKRSPEIQAMEQELAELLKTYTSDHASVVALRKRLEQAIAARDQKK